MFPRIHSAAACPAFQWLNALAVHTYEFLEATADARLYSGCGPCQMKADDV